MIKQADVAIIGGGIVGLATAHQLTQLSPSCRVVILEKEVELARHQSGNNSGVLHSGVYYKPGSLKATNCRAGKEAMEHFCETEEIDYEICGKVIVAVSEDEMPTLQMIYERGRANGVRCELIGQARLEELEPHTAGIAALHVPEAGIVNYAQVCERLADRVRERGGEIMTSARVVAMATNRELVVLQSTAGEVAAPFVINCAGLYSDRLTTLSGGRPGVQIVPFRGEFYELVPEAQHLCRNMIYPVPDSNFPFLGAHFTRTIDGRVECGPNAVLAFAREGYTRSTVNLPELVETLIYPGFLKLAARYWQTGLGEMWRSFSKSAFVRTLQRLIPEIRAVHLKPAPSGVRAQAITPDGRLLDDFLIQETERIINVCNAPSPAATASLNIGYTIAQKLASRL